MTPEGVKRKAGYNFFTPPQDEIFIALIIRLDRVNEISKLKSLTESENNEMLNLLKLQYKVFGTLQKKYSKDIVSPFMTHIITGETEVLFKSTADILAVKFDIFSQMKHSTVTFGAGTGTMSMISPESSQASDGPAFWAAREDFEKNEKKQKKRRITPNKIHPEFYETRSRLGAG